jgi:hypothetical protein
MSQSLRITLNSTRKHRLFLFYFPPREKPVGGVTVKISLKNNFDRRSEKKSHRGATQNELPLVSGGFLSGKDFSCVLLER